MRHTKVESITVGDWLIRYNASTNFASENRYCINYGICCPLKKKNYRCINFKSCEDYLTKVSMIAKLAGSV